MVNTHTTRKGPRILDLHNDGRTPREIADTVGVSRANVYSHLKRRDLTPNRRSS